MSSTCTFCLYYNYSDGVTLYYNYPQDMDDVHEGALSNLAPLYCEHMDSLNDVLVFRVASSLKCKSLYNYDMLLIPHLIYTYYTIILCKVNL